MIHRPGHILDVDLGSREVTTFQPPEAWHRDFIGGRGLGVRILSSDIPPGLDPLDPAMPLLFLVGPLTGTNFPTAGRFVVVSRSPLTGTVFDAHSGGFFGAELAAAGLDGIRFRGTADRPTYVFVEDGRVEFRDASDFWGLETQETRDRILEQTPKGTRVAMIGPAGEKRVLLAAIMNDSGRAAGRGGLGAVMGSKNLKAVAVRGSAKPDPAVLERLRKAREYAQRVLKKNPITSHALPTLGTAVLVNIINAHGMFPTRNFREAVFNDAEGVSGEKMAERIVVKKTTCFSCPISCGRHTRTSRESGEGPEYETVWAFGAQCGVNDLEAVTHANYRCNRLGLDTISVGSTIGCAMELAEEGLLSGIPPFGDAEAVVETVERIGRREGIGERLGEGSMRLAAGVGRPELAMHVKGLELPAYDPRGVQGQALAYATANRGGC
ncbi:MAG: aldehyde ferredoxin oxidoreductase family protein, partial [Planctomycetota bacterium]